MGHLFSRRELYDLVWSESRVALSKRLGISDVGLSKVCIRANIPIPPRGYWARRDAGKRDPQPPLPPRALGQFDLIEIGQGQDQRPSDQEEMTLPPAPVFDKSTEVVRARASAMVEKCKVPKNLNSPHHLIGTLLEEDAARRKAVERDRFAWSKPEFDTPQAMRRVRIVNALFMVMAHARCKVSLHGKDLRQVNIHVSDVYISVRIEPVKTSSRSSRPDADDERKTKQERIKLCADGWGPMPGVTTEWQDTEDQMLEHRAHEVARDILVLAEMLYRSHVLQQYEWRVERKNELEEKARQRREQQEREERERKAKLEQECRDWLLQQSSNLQKANEIRTFVQTMDQRMNDAVSDVDANRYQQWRQWALSEANRLDPLLQPLAAVIGPMNN